MSLLSRLKAGLRDNSTISETPSEDRQSAGQSVANSRRDSEAGSSDGGNRGLALLRRRMTTWKSTKQASGRGLPLFGKIQESVPMEPTYRMEPTNKQKFGPAKVKTIAQNILEQYLKDIEYNPKICARMSQRISDEIKKRVKLLGYERYKIICYVMIVERREQALQFSSRCLWDDKQDSSATANFHNKSLYATATVFGTYFD